MRPDINKVLCERERKGDAGDWARTQKNYYDRAHFPRPDYEDRYTEFAHLDSLPRYESMRARFGGSIRDFGENLGALYGWVRSLVGKPWDKAYSELCHYCPPNGTNVQRHAHVHLDSYIERSTVVLDDGTVGYNYGGYARSGLYLPISQSHCQYFVHPKTKLVCRNKVHFSKKNNVHWKVKEQQELDKVIKVTKTDIYVKLNGIWYGYQVEEPHIVRSTRWDFATKQIVGYNLVANPDQLKDLFCKEYPKLRYRIDKLYIGNARNKRQLGFKELKKFGLHNDLKVA